jgi:hypothetical protein
VAFHSYSRFSERLCAGKVGLREPGEHTSGPNLASGDNVAHNQNLYTILETPPPVIPLCRGAVLPPSNEYFPSSEKQCGGFPAIFFAAIIGIIVGRNWTPAGDGQARVKALQQGLHELGWIEAATSASIIAGRAAMRLAFAIYEYAPLSGVAEVDRVLG